MITAVDTSVLLDVFAPSDEHLERSRNALRKCRREGSLIVCDIVVAELRPGFASSADIMKALGILEIGFTPMPQEAALLAGESWEKYRNSGGKRDRLVPDFLIAAHALVVADRLLTRDRGFSRKWFRALRVLEP